MDIFSGFGLCDKPGKCTEEGVWIEVHGMAFSHVRCSVFLSTTRVAAGLPGQLRFLTVKLHTAKALKS